MTAALDRAVANALGLKSVKDCEKWDAPKPVHCQCTACKDGILHASDCAAHNGPAYPNGPCDCGVEQPTNNEKQTAQPDRYLVELLHSVSLQSYKMGYKDALSKREWNFCERCGKRTPELTTIHTCTPPQ